MKKGAIVMDEELHRVRNIGGIYGEKSKTGIYFTNKYVFALHSPTGYYIIIQDHIQVHWECVL